SALEDDGVLASLPVNRHRGYLSACYGWTEPEIDAYLDNGTPPDGPRFEARPMPFDPSRMIGSGDAPRGLSGFVLQLVLDPWLSAEAVAKLYRRTQRLVGPAARPLSMRRLQLFQLAQRLWGDPPPEQPAWSQFKSAKFPNWRNNKRDYLETRAILSLSDAGPSNQKPGYFLREDSCADPESSFLGR